MRKVKLFIASSLDGYIARMDGSIDWLYTDDDYSFAQFYDCVDTILMGSRTYEKTLELAWGIHIRTKRITYLLKLLQEGKEKRIEMYIL